VADTFGFSLNDAKRIGRAVRVVERDGARQDLTGEKDGTVSRGVRLMLAKHESTAGWAKETTATVTVYGGDPLASAITVVAHNQFLTFSTNTACTQHWVALGHNGWGWYAISQEKACTSTCSMDYAGVDFSGIAGFDRTKIQLLGHNSGTTASDSTDCVSLKWYDITTCSTAA
jgi:hypothetical protein